MGDIRALEAIKGAILLEHRGRDLYKHFVRTVKNDAIRSIFETMVDEERHHLEVLGEHFKALVKDGTLADISYEAKPVDTAGIISKDILGQISVAGDEAAAISAAMALEEKAVDFYRKSAGTAQSDTERALFNWLANWEETHLQFLAKIDRELTERVWGDNSFWPLY